MDPTASWACALAALVVLLGQSMASTGRGAAADAVHGGQPRAPARCRTFYAHGDTAGRDAAEFSTLLLWREHADVDARDDGTTVTWTLAVNVTATEGARVMLGSAVRALPGQPHYELVLGDTTNASRLNVYPTYHGPAPKPLAPSLPLFEEGALQLWLRWRVRRGVHGGTVHGGGGANHTATLEVSVLPAGRNATTLLFNYTTAKPIQLETFSFGSSKPGDVSFTVCSSNTSAKERAHKQSGPGVGVPGCRSLFVHVQSQQTHGSVRRHDLAMDWTDMADHHGRLQFWARASTDVEVVVSEKLHIKPGDYKYHVVFGGDFNSRSWVVGYVGGSRFSAMDTPALLSDFQFRPLWLSVSSHGDIKAGSGALDKNHTSSMPVRRLVAWRHPRAPTPKFITFTTFRQRLVHVLIDCTESPSLPTTSPYPSDLIDFVRRSIASPSSLILDIEKVSMHKHNDTVTAEISGNLRKTWQNINGNEWNPIWFEEVQKIQFWLSDSEKSLGNEMNPTITVFSNNNGKKRTRLEPGPLEVHANKTMSWEFPLRLKLTCRGDTDQFNYSCFIDFEVHSKLGDCYFEAMENMKIGPHWKAHWSFVSNKTDNCSIHLDLMSHLRQENPDSSSSVLLQHTQEGQSTNWARWICIALTTAALITAILEHKQLPTKSYQKIFSTNFITRHKFFQKILRAQSDIDDKVFIVGYNGGLAEIMPHTADGPYQEFSADGKSSNMITEGNKKKIPAQEHGNSIFQYLNMTVGIILALLFFLILDLILVVQSRKN